ncbi:unnamed protein product [Calypogeia fissa]
MLSRAITMRTTTKSLHAAYATSPILRQQPISWSLDVLASLTSALPTGTVPRDGSSTKAIDVVKYVRR